MKRNRKVIRVTAIVLLATFCHMAILPVPGLAQSHECPYDKNNPTLESARISFKSLNYKCAEKEIEDFLKRTDASLEDKASAHVLLAAVYYAMVKDHNEKRNRVLDQFKEAFRSYREWAGELDISSTEFIDLMKKAQDMVDEEEKEPETAAVPPPDTTTAKKPVIQPVTEPAAQPVTRAEVTTAEKGGKAWYKQWWAIGLGVGLVAGAVVLLAGGGGDDEEKVPDPPIGDFPDPPSKK